jgi:hypothetical protein
VSEEPDRVRWRSLALDPDCVLGPWARLAVAVLTEEMGGARCYVSVPTLARRMAVSTRLVYYAIAELEHEGFLDVERRAGVTNLYRRVLPQPLHDVHGSSRTGERTGAQRAHDPDTQIHRYPLPPASGGTAQKQIQREHPARLNRTAGAVASERAPTWRRLPKRSGRTSRREASRGS